MNIFENQKVCSVGFCAVFERVVAWDGWFVVQDFLAVAEYRSLG